MTKSKKRFSKIKLIYLLLIVILPIYAAFALQFVPRLHQDGYNGQGWPFVVCGPVDHASDIGLLLLNASIVIGAVYGLVILSVVIRCKYFHQMADGSKISHNSAKKS